MLYKWKLLWLPCVDFKDKTNLKKKTYYTDLIKETLPESLSRFSTLVLQPLLEWFNKFTQMPVTQSLPDFIIRVLAKRIQIQAQTSREDHRILWM